jgi:hypothetical protein
MSDLAHFLRVGLRIDQLAIFKKLSRAFCARTPFRAAFAAWLAFAALLPGLLFPKLLVNDGIYNGDGGFGGLK